MKGKSLCRWPPFPSLRKQLTSWDVYDTLHLAVKRYVQGVVTAFTSDEPSLRMIATRGITLGLDTSHRDGASADIGQVGGGFPQVEGCSREGNVERRGKGLISNLREGRAGGATKLFYS